LGIAPFDYDSFRQTKLQNWGIQFIRFNDLDVKKNMEGVLCVIKRKISEIVDRGA
jgi:very-short-patch-repair endonuclease